MEPAAVMADEGSGGAEPPAEALRLAQSGDIAAFERLMRHYERRVFLTALRLLGSRADAEDAAQEVFLRLHRHLRRISGGDPGPWIYRVTVNVCRDMARVRPPAASVEDTAASVDTEREAGLRERRRLLESALAGLPPKQRAALVLRDIEGLSTREVARALGSSEATVRSQVSTARLRAKEFLERMLRRRS